MKKHLLSFVMATIVALFSMNMMAQVSINNDGSEPNPSAMLDIKSTSKGLLLPRWTRSQMDSCEYAADGLIIYCTDCRVPVIPDTGAIAIRIKHQWYLIPPLCGVVPYPPSAGTHVPTPIQITWNWNPVSNATGYKWNSTNVYASAIDMSGATSTIQTGLTCNTLYSSYVWAYNDCGHSTPTTLTQITSLDPPATPTAGNHLPSPTQIDWYWNPVADATGYKWNTINDYASSIEMSTATSTTQTGLTCNTLYTSYVWAYNNCGNSTPATLTQITSLDPLATPTAGNHVPSPTQIDWQWNQVAGATGYKWNTTNDYASAFDLMAETSWIQAGLICNTPYTSYVWAYNDCGNSTPATLTQTTSLDPPAAPTPGAHMPSQTQIVWYWNPVAEATGYKWNTTNDYASATDMTNDLSMTQTGLICNTLYTSYVWAYNDCGNSASVTLTETTSSCGVPCPGTPTVDYGGITYNTVQIGLQCWLKENLNIGILINGTQNQTNEQYIEKYCYNDLESNCDIYGGLYQWNEAMQYATTAGVQGICPAGWHLPTDTEWTDLTTFLGGESVAGGKMKVAGLVYWLSPNTGATNSSGFSVLPGGRRYDDGNFYSLNNTANFWSSSSESSSSYAWNRSLLFSDANVYRNDYFKTSGFSVRCLKD